MARHLAEFLARPFDGSDEQGMPPWVAEVAAALFATAAALYVAGRDGLGALATVVGVLLTLFPHALGRRVDRHTATPTILVIGVNVALLALLVCVGLALGIVVAPPTVTLPLLGVVLLPLAYRLVRLLRPRRPSRR